MFIVYKTLCWTKMIQLLSLLPSSPTHPQWEDKQFNKDYTCVVMQKTSIKVMLWKTNYISLHSILPPNYSIFSFYPVPFSSFLFFFLVFAFHPDSFLKSLFLTTPPPICPSFHHLTPLLSPSPLLSCWVRYPIECACYSLLKPNPMRVRFTHFLSLPPHPLHCNIHHSYGRCHVQSPKGHWILYRWESFSDASACGEHCTNCVQPQDTTEPL